MTTSLVDCMEEAVWWLIKISSASGESNDNAFSTAMQPPRSPPKTRCRTAHRGEHGALVALDLLLDVHDLQLLQHRQGLATGGTVTST